MKNEFLGIGVGDGITTSYHDTPYEVIEVSEPEKFYWDGDNEIFIFDHPVVNLVLRDLRDNSTAWISTIRQVGNRWFTEQNDEIFVKKTGDSQPDLFFEIPEYPFEDGVNYKAGVGKVWRCSRCERDFNTKRKNKLPNCCPDCGWTTIPIFYIAAPPDDDFRPRPSVFSVALNFEEYAPYAL